ncbi:3',5'-cyclic-nucleotide phosphodiesterase [Methylorubrum aminovorans]
MYRSVIAALVFTFAPHGAGAQTGSLSQGDRAALKASCGSDYATFCGDLAPDGPEVQACFRKNLADLSPACRAEIGRREKSGKKG